MNRGFNPISIEGLWAAGRCTFATPWRGANRQREAKPIGVWNILNPGDHKGRPYNINIRPYNWQAPKPCFVGAALVAARISGYFTWFQTSWHSRRASASVYMVGFCGMWIGWAPVGRTPTVAERKQDCSLPQLPESFRTFGKFAVA